jgi:hypothetical protein
MNPVPSPTAEKPPNPRWFHPTPARLLILLLAVEGSLLLSKPWLPKGYAVLIAITSVIVTMVLMLLWWLFALSFRWRFQFSLRSLLVATVAVAIPFSWLAVEMKKARRQREVVERIQKLGDRVGVRYDYVFTPPFCFEMPGPVWLRKLVGDDFFASVEGVHLDEMFETDIALPYLRELPRLWELHLENTQVTEAGLEHLKGLTQLRWLSLANTHVTDAGLQHLAGLTHLEQLILSDTQATDGGLQHLNGLTQLYLLWLDDTHVTDTGLEHLKELIQLLNVRLDNTQVTDAGLKSLKGLTQLQSLSLHGTHVTDKGVQELQLALPNCNIQR